MLKNIKWKNYMNYIIVSVVAVVFSILSFSGALDNKRSLTGMLEQILIAVILAVSLSVVVGFLGELSLGHAGFMCLGAYIGGKVATLLDADASNHLVLILTVFLGGIVAAIFGFIIGLPALRLKGDYLAIVTLAFGQIVVTIFKNTSKETFGGSSGLATIQYGKSYLFIYCFAFLLITLAVIQNLIKSKHGRAITAIRDNEIAAKSTGINVTKYKLMAFVVSAFFAGVAGVLFSHSQSLIDPRTFEYNYSIEILVLVVIGGMSSINGAIISAALVTFLKIKLSDVLTGNLSVLQNIIYALVLVCIVIYRNAPMFKTFREKYNTRKLLDKVGALWAKIGIGKKKTEATDPGDEGAWDRIPTKIKMDEILSVDVKVTESTKNPDKEES